MSRLKLTLFAVPALIVAGVQLSWVSKQAVQSAAENARLDAERAAAQVKRSLAERETLFAQAMFEVSTDDAVRAAIPVTKKGEPVAPNAEAFETLRSAVRAHLPEALRESAVIGWSGEGSALLAVGTAAPQERIDGVDLSKATSGSMSLLADHRLAASFSPHAKAMVTVSVPAFDAKLLDGNVAAMGLVQNGKLLVSTGSEAKDFETELATGKAGIVKRAAAKSAFGLPLPLFAGELSGAQAPAAVLVRVPGEPEVAAIVRAAPAVEAVGAAQQTGVEVLLGLVVLFGIVLAVSGEKREGGSDVLKLAPQSDLQATRAVDLNASTRKAEAGSPTQAMTVRAAVAPSLALADAPVAEASPDDFQFGSAPSAPPAPAPESAAESADPFGKFDLPSSSEAVESQGREPSLPFDTTPAPAPAQGYAEEEPDEATRVAAVPADLLHAAASVHRPEPSAPVAAAMPAVAPSVSSDPDEAHFQDVFREFVTVREQCGEPADGVTFEKFVPKLRKKRDELASKGGGAVRFQVYVKDGKPALRASVKKE